MNLDSLYEKDFNYNHRYYRNDSPELWTNNGYTTKVGDEATYLLNSQGYRCDEFNQHSELPVLFMGCSNTFGLGLQLETSWAYNILTYIRNKTNKTIPYWNISRNGSSVDLQYFNLEQHIKTIRPKFIFFLIPSLYRRLMFLNKNAFQIQVGENRPYENLLPLELRMARGLLANPGFAYAECHKYFMLINKLCEQYNTTLFYQFVDVFRDETEYPILKEQFKAYTMFNELNTLWAHGDVCVDHARDLAHRGPISHSIFAKGIWKEVEQHF